MKNTIIKENNPTEFLLVKSHCNWVDEMDIDGFVLFLPEEWTSHMKLDQKAFSLKGSNDMNICVGSNEEVDFDGFEQYKKMFEVKEITYSEAMTLCKLFKLKIPTSSSSKYCVKYGGFTTHDNHYLQEVINEHSSGSAWLKANGYS